jgi:hypothetical protein
MNTENVVNFIRSSLQEVEVVAMNAVAVWDEEDELSWDLIVQVVLSSDEYLLVLVPMLENEVDPISNKLYIPSERFAMTLKVEEAIEECFFTPFEMIEACKLC